MTESRDQLEIRVQSCPIDHDGHYVQVREWKMSQAKARRPLLIVPDFGKTLEEYGDFCHGLARAGERVYAYDWRSQGQSSAFPPHKPSSLSQWTSDLKQVAALCRFESERSRLAILSFGLSTLVVSTWAKDAKNDIECIAFATPRPPTLPKPGSSRYNSLKLLQLISPHLRIVPGIAWQLFRIPIPQALSARELFLFADPKHWQSLLSNIAPIDACQWDDSLETLAPRTLSWLSAHRSSA